MVFNVLCGNRDDHLRNHALVRRDGGWRLSRAFDVVPQPDMDPQQAIGVGWSGGFPTTGNCLTRARDFDLSRDEAGDIVASLVARMRFWREDFIADGVDEATVRRLARAFSKDLDHPPARGNARYLICTLSTIWRNFASVPSRWSSRTMPTARR